VPDCKEKILCGANLGKNGRSVGAVLLSLRC
jgi:hypothetical protein